MEAGGEGTGSPFGSLNEPLLDPQWMERQQGRTVGVQRNLKETAIDYGSHVVLKRRTRARLGHHRTPIGANSEREDSGKP